MTPPIGRLAHRVTFTIPSVATDSVGQEIETYGTPFDRWAKVDEMPAGESNIYDGTEAKRRIMLTVRTVNSKTAIETWRVLYDGRTWNVKSFRFIDDKHRYAELVAELLL